MQGIENTRAAKKTKAPLCYLTLACYCLCARNQVLVLLFSQSVCNSLGLFDPLRWHLSQCSWSAPLNMF